MNDHDRPRRTLDGRLLGEEETAALGDEALRGYDPTQIRRRPGRPRIGESPAVVMPVRLHDDVLHAAREEAERQSTSVSEVVRRAVRAHLAVPAMPPPPDPASLSAAAAEAARGYPPDLAVQRTTGRARATAVPFRVPPETKHALEERAEAEATSVSEVVRSALRRLPAPPSAAAVGGTRATPKRTEAETCRDFVLPLLRDAGWTDDQIVEQYRITDGRVVPVGAVHRRGAELRADYVLERSPGVPVAVVEAKRQDSDAGRGLQQARNYAELLDVPLAFATNGREIVEADLDTGRETAGMSAFPTPDAAWARYRTWKGFRDDAVDAALLGPFNRSLRTSDGATKEPRYYQRVAVNRVVEAVVGGEKRALLTMATGTGKTFVAMQIVWKLWNSSWTGGRRPRVLYLADRNVLVDQPIEREFGPAFGYGEGSPVWKLRGVRKPGREIYFGLYQQLADTGERPDGLFRQFARDYFDLVIVDECHRGSARAESSWRRILDHFAPAAQLGMTATPRRDETADTYDYFGGRPLLEYSLAQGIDDGFLAPYRVRRVVLSPDARGWEPTAGQLDMFGREVPAGLYTTPDFERVVSLLSRTDAAAKHLTAFMRSTDRHAKTIVFCVNQEHADQMRRAIHNHNRDLAARHPDYAVRIVSDEHVVGQGHLSRFCDTDSAYPVVATTSEMLSTGVDAPTVRNIVLFRPVGSMALFKQMIGRGTRLFPDDDKLSFDIVDYSGASVLFSDPDFDGPPESVVVEAVDANGDVIGTAHVPPLPASRSMDPTPDGQEASRPRAKFYVDGVDVTVDAEAVYALDPADSRLRLVEYRDLVTQTVRSLYPTANELRTRWTSRPTRAQVIDALSAHGVEPAELADRTGLSDADPLDILVHLAWNHPLATRIERVRRVRAQHAAFFEEFRPAAREVLEELLEKYARHGISELESPGALLVPPLSAMGTPVEIARRFGSAPLWRAAQTRLAELVYAA